jgi:phosphoglycolate phosphatase
MRKIAPSVVYLDVDGTLTDPMPRYYKTYLHSLAYISNLMKEDSLIHSLCPLSFHDFRKKKRIQTTDVEVGKVSGIPDGYIDNYLTQVRNMVNSDILHSIDPAFPYTDWALNAFNRQGFEIVLVTLRPIREVNQILSHHGWSPLIKDVYGSTSSEAVLKNYSEIKSCLLGEALSSHSMYLCGKENMFMIGDTEADICAGKSHNISTISVTSGLRSRSHLFQHSPDLILPDLKSVAMKFRQFSRLAG